MPEHAGARGFSACCMCAASTLKVPVVIISSNDHPVIRRAQFESAAGFIPKSAP